MIAALDSFFHSMAWPMEVLPAYGAFHILFTLFGFVLCGFAAWKLRRVGDKTVEWILFWCGLALAVSEVVKQFFCYFVIAENTYHWGEFPFQLCSTPMYMCMAVPFVKNQQHKRAMYSFMVFYNLLGGAISFTEPSGLFHEYVFLTAHSCLWHMTLVFVGLLICCAQRVGAQKLDYKSATKIFIVLCGVAFVMNCLVQFGLGEKMNMFFVGPGNSPIIVFKQFSEWFGWYINTPIYIFAVCLGAYLVFALIYWLRNKQLPMKMRQKVSVK